MRTRKKNENIKQRQNVYIFNENSNHETNAQTYNTYYQRQIFIKGKRKEKVSHNLILKIKRNE